MQLSKRRPKSQQPRLLFVDEQQAELWSRLSLEQQQRCRNLLSQLLQQILSQPDNASEPDERSNPPVKEPAKKPPIVKVGRETAGRRGKGVTTVFDVPLDETRAACGTLPAR